MLWKNLQFEQVVKQVVEQAVEQAVELSGMNRISIIIPTLNEARSLGATLRHLGGLEPPPWEVIVVDGGSVDQTVAIAQQLSQAQTFPLAVQIVQMDKSGRSLQLNRGAEAATGEVLCFLHADTFVPADLVAVIGATLAKPKVVCGGFISLMAGPEATRWGISLHNYLKTYYAPLLFRPHLFVRGLRLLFGDQVMFCRREDFWDCGGFDPALPILEEADLCLKLVRRGQIRQVNRVVQSSDRRVTKWGAWKATAIYVYIGCLWGIGVSPTYLKRFYEDIR